MISVLILLAVAIAPVSGAYIHYDLSTSSVISTKPANIAQPSQHSGSMVTSAPQLAPLRIRRRQETDNGCGYYPLADIWRTLSCPIGCRCNTYTPPTGAATAYCSAPGELPLTEVFEYPEWPIGGCRNGQICCSSNYPYAGEYVYNNGATVLLGCGDVRFTVSATTSIPGATAKPSLSASTTGFSSTASSTTTSSSTSTNPSDQAQSINNNNNGSIGSLSAGTVAGITIASVVFTAIGATAGVWVCCCRPYSGQRQE